ncbi:LacI family DNA-binding transcriptional regulator [Leifsonia sp. TF02-11]|uniref:LacI family DNA-binding transcriptional regulator n=1 Tax=Leifsonia sp. TF02-11 TaxID=2815212 RepID=UPI001AA0FAF1|nr:LacI family DNA-binding transcriptional regulator [Leifsonia sp. TF02-11]MBO1741559.1 LacI family DNA-binding transcriptional regulator [Leifsonia sp. TF02-11]
MKQISTMRDVADRAGVSVATVSNYLNDAKPVASKTRARIESAMQELKFVPSIAGRMMRGGRSAAVGFISIDAPDPYFVEVARGIEDVARESGCVLISCNTGGDLTREKQYVEALATMRIVGAIVHPAFTGAGESHLDRLRDAGSSVVLLGADESDYDACGVSTDDVRGGFLAVEHLISLGHKRIAFVGGPGGERQMRDRFAGALGAVRAACLAELSLQRIDASGTSIAARAEVGARIAALSERPTAVFCASDSLALAVCGTFARLGIRVPEDIAVVGYANTDQTELASIPISTIAVPQYEIGRTAAHLLMSESQSGHQHTRTVFQPRLIVRESTVGHRG